MSKGKSALPIGQNLFGVLFFGFSVVVFFKNNSLFVCLFSSFQVFQAAGIPESTYAGNKMASCFSGTITRVVLKGVVSLQGGPVNWMFRTMASKPCLWFFYIFKQEGGTSVGQVRPLR